MQVTHRLGEGWSCQQRRQDSARYKPCTSCESRRRQFLASCRYPLGTSWAQRTASAAALRAIWQTAECLGLTVECPVNNLIICLFQTGYGCLAKDHQIGRAHV